ncbi:oxygenase MpaB family protein [Glutamicibacter protophormiae]|uniref:Uncharacterized protein (DUF2236 family) n=1 Tax=Glutamicibacter protophormiae TaxID=37930 RepID=A0ABS4XLF8_GLUPR|nr:oxygenase MpaB family protein [Glutamicibacter protophormiae]MBP2397215.1 uncharacterized protein (DUF2236 family) [Glutamicibacter protophormiae]GGM00508.1 hypothetical protein GCM10010038_33180 [Glutamicibacter protophormiae]
MNPQPEPQPFPRDQLAKAAPESALLLGAGRAILLQLAHPQIGRAIAEHSDFAANPLSRLLHTLGYIYALSNGTAEQQRTIIDYVDAAHRPVRGARDKATGAPAYSALDPRLQQWVAATLFDSARVIGSQVLPAWDHHASEELYRQYARLGDALQMPTHFWPETEAGFNDYFAGVTANLHVTDQIRKLADELFTGSRAPWWIRVALPLMRDVTIAQLPPRIREQFGYELTRRVELRNRVTVRAAWAASRIFPKAIRHLPMKLMLRHVDGMASGAKSPAQPSS